MSIDSPSLHCHVQPLEFHDSLFYVVFMPVAIPTSILYAIFVVHVAMVSFIWNVAAVLRIFGGPALLAL